MWQSCLKRVADSATHAVKAETKKVVKTIKIGMLIVRLRDLLQLHIRSQQ